MLTKGSTVWPAAISWTSGEERPMQASVLMAAPTAVPAGLPSTTAFAVLWGWRPSQTRFGRQGTQGVNEAWTEGTLPTRRIPCHAGCSIRTGVRGKTELGLPRTVIDAVRWRGDQGVLSLRCSPRFFKVHVGQIYGTVNAGWGRILVPTLRAEAAGAGPFFREPRIRLRRCPWSLTTTL